VGTTASPRERRPSSRKPSMGDTTKENTDPSGASKKVQRQGTKDKDEMAAVAAALEKQGSRNFARQTSKSSNRRNSHKEAGDDANAPSAAEKERGGSKEKVAPRASSKSRLPCDRRRTLKKGGGSSKNIKAAAV